MTGCWMAHYHLGVIYYKQGDFEKAKIEFKRLLQEDPEDSASARYLKLMSEQKLTNSNTEKP